MREAILGKTRKGVIWCGDICPSSLPAGKTYVGLKIVRALLDNRVAWDPESTSPMLMVCYTNHALDQFLEGVLDFQTKGVIRVGGRSSSLALEERNLHKYITFSDNKHRVVSDLKTSQESWEKINHLLERSKYKILSLKQLVDFVGKLHLQQLSFHEYKFASRNVHVVEGWLGVESSSRQSSSGNKGERPTPEVKGLRNDAKNADDGIDVDRDADIVESQRFVSGNEYEPIRGTQGSSSKRESREKSRVYLSENQIKILRGHSNLRPLTLAEVAQVQDVWNLTVEERWRLYLFWLRLYQGNCHQEIFAKTREYESTCKRLAEVQKNDELNVLRGAVVIGMTTTGAAKYHAVLEEIQPKVVIVEEAAEVLEAHIITSLTQGTQHLILIGDHKQLRPNPQVYELSKKYKLDVSLFERMVNNGMHCNLLTTQHRMRPEISSLMKFIYEDLKDHESVRSYENIRGVDADVYFVDHEFLEDESAVNTRLKSHSNQHEAEFVVALCEYFLHQGYNPDQITVLTMYTGQLLTLKKMMPRTKFEGVRVTAVDNFQGEENDVILLSLVRSNEKGSIGFLGVRNRVCVALSRARKGLYCIGNFSLLAEKSDLWANIVEHMRAQDAFGRSLKLICRNHPGREIHAETADHFKQAPEGGCILPCQFRLRCGHVCERACHPIDREHELYQCRKDCLADLCHVHERKCERKCHHGEPCDGCPVQMKKIIPKCGHEQLVPCGTCPEDVSCQAVCQVNTISGES